MTHSNSTQKTMHCRKITDFKKGALFKSTSLLLLLVVLLMPQRVQADWTANGDSLATQQTPGTYTVENVTITKVSKQPTPTNWDGKVFRPVAIGSKTRIVRIAAQISPVAEGKKVHWYYEDPDQEAGHLPDMHDGKGDDNNPAGKKSAFGGTIKRAITTTNAQGVAIMDFPCSSIGGDNYRVRASHSATGANGKWTPIFTVWKRIVFEEPDAIAGYATDASVIDGELAQVFVKREVILGTADTITYPDPAPSQLSANGAYGPASLGELFTTKYRDPVSEEDSYGLPCWQIVTVRSESVTTNKIGNTSKEPFDSANPPNFGKIAVPGANPAAEVLDFEHPGDTSTAEDRDIDSVGNRTSTDKHSILLFSDTNAVTAMWLGLDLSFVMKTSVWHEVGHVLGADHPSDNEVKVGGPGNVMYSAPRITSQTDIFRARERQLKRKWIDEDATKIRIEYVG